MKREGAWANLFFYILLAAVLLSQYMIKTESLAAANNFSADDKIPAAESSYYIRMGKLGLKFSDENINILINGKDKNPDYRVGEVSFFSVKEGDIIQADLRNSGGEGVVYVYSVTGDIIHPKFGSKYSLRGGIVNLFAVEFIK